MLLAEYYRRTGISFLFVCTLALVAQFAVDLQSHHPGRVPAHALFCVFVAAVYGALSIPFAHALNGTTKAQAVKSAPFPSPVLLTLLQPLLQCLLTLGAGLGALVIFDAIGGDVTRGRQWMWMVAFGFGIGIQTLVRSVALRHVERDSGSHFYATQRSPRSLLMKRVVEVYDRAPGAPRRA